MGLLDTYAKEGRDAAAAGPDPHVLLRPDRLRARAHRQRAAVRHRHVAAQLAARDRLQRDVRPQHHGRQRQDLRRRAGRERRARQAGDRVVPRGHGRPRARHAGRDAEGDRERAGDRRVHRGADRRGHAYEADGDVYFRVSSFADYGQLSRPAARPGRRRRSRTRTRRTRATSRSGRRRRTGEDTSWDSPWGRGRPGWHIECSAMAEKLLGAAFEIHGGGLDLVFPHHENELAQSRALGHEFAPIWAHNGLVRFTGEKMSKSDGNIVTIREAIDTLGPRGAAALLPRRALAQADRLLRGDDGAGGGPGRDASATRTRQPKASGSCSSGTSFADALDDDFNTPDALAVMHDWRERPARPARRGARALRARVARRAEPPPEEIVALAEARAGARARRATSTRPTGCAPRSTAAGWEMRDEHGGLRARAAKP